METRTITLNGGPHDGETKHIPATMDCPDYWVFAPLNLRCTSDKPRGRGAWRYTQDPDRPDQYHYQEQ